MDEEAVGVTVVSRASLPTTQTVPTAFELLPTFKPALTIVFVPPATVSVPCEPGFSATRTLPASHVPLDTVNCPMPEKPTVVAALVMMSRPPVIHTAPVAPSLPPKLIIDVSVLVPPAIVNVPTELVLVPTYISRARNVPFEIVICPTPLRPTKVVLLVMPPKFVLLVTANEPPVIHTVPVVPAPPAAISRKDILLVPPAMVSVPGLPTETRLPAHVPLDTVICPTPLPPTTVVSLETVSCPPVIQTAPVAPTWLPVLKKPNRFVPPAIANVPRSLRASPAATITSLAINVPLETVNVPVPVRPTYSLPVQPLVATTVPLMSNTEPSIVKLPQFGGSETLKLELVIKRLPPLVI